MRQESVACIRFESPPGSGKFLGCGRGWTQPAGGPYTCIQCMRKIVVTGAYTETPLRRITDGSV